MRLALLAMSLKTAAIETSTQEIVGVMVAMKLTPNTRGTFSAQGFGPNSVRIYAEGFSRADAREKWLAKFTERTLPSTKRGSSREAA